MVMASNAVRQEALGRICKDPSSVEQNVMITRVGLIGLDAMGGGMVPSLRRAGRHVHAFDGRPGSGGVGSKIKIINQLLAVPKTFPGIELPKAVQ